ncbi:ureidoglycolate lyase [Bradyrhizobium guangzhouense]|uniref:Ureidoglycolate lyase n=1 Tax=Bradyrhizobium guangzhouense TaxID=1325095 RepID=A0ABY0EBN2_9BRAD|nr:ureidoglycolate lyase [Bradyrhizobium guangzhouense]RXH13848.1 ureidoglycolate lyase [Bradyrhizobium guangzhouense]RXH16668.1 ureidoglycolate lyase [Bradyrhizobium guangzhouense]
MATLSIEPLTKQAFSPFGEVIEADGAIPLSINQGFARRFNDLAYIDVAAEGGQTNISWFVASLRPAPIAIRLMERHPLGSQLFMPLNGADWLVVVCSDPRDAASYRAFAATGQQGVNYARNCWHHPLLVLKDASSFLVVDRKGDGNNLEECWLDETMRLALMPDYHEA